MAVLNREEFFTKINTIIGTNTDDASITFVEDMTDTYNDMEKRANGDGENWEQKYYDLDEAWKKKYTNRFFSSGGNSNIPHEDAGGETKKNPSDIRIEDLFTPSGK